MNYRVILVSMVYVHEGSSIICVRDATAKIWNQSTEQWENLFIEGHKEDFRAYNLQTVPCRLAISTEEDKVFDVKVLSQNNKGINIEYSEIRTPKQYKASLPNGVEVELLGYSKLDTGLHWYGPDGSEFELPGVNAADIDDIGTVVAVRMQPTNFYLYAYITDVSGKGGRKVFRVESDNIWLIAVDGERRFVNLGLRVLRTGNWIKSKKCVFSPLMGDRRTGKTNIPSERIDAKVIRKGETEVSFYVPREFQYKMDWGKLIAHSKNGAEEVYDREVYNHVLPAKGWQKGYFAMLTENVDELTIEYRHLTESVMTFRNLSLQPGYETDVQIEIE